MKSEARMGTSLVQLDVCTRDAKESKQKQKENCLNSFIDCVLHASTL